MEEMRGRLDDSIRLLMWMAGKTGEDLKCSEREQNEPVSTMALLV